MPLTDSEQRLCRLIEQRRDRLASELARHVAIPTGWNHAPGLDSYRSLIVKRLCELEASVEHVAGDAKPAWLSTPASEHPGADRTPAPPVAVIQHRSKQATPRVLIAGHLDTVHDPQGPFQSMTLAGDGRTAVGPGVVDMKGGILVAVTALEILHEAGVDLHWTFLLNSDEETGSFHSFRAIDQAAREHDLGIALEPSLPDGSLVVERMGSGQFKIEVFGRAAHVGRDFAHGVSAVVKLAEIITALAAMSDPARGVIVNVGPLQGGSVTNAVPEHAACWGNVRFKDQAAAEALGAKFDALNTAGDALPRVVVHKLFNRPAKPLTPEVRRFAEAVRGVAEELDHKMPFASTGGVCDGNIMQAAGLATLDTLGVRGGKLHTPEEYIDVASLVERAQLLAVLLSRIAEGRVAAG